MNFRVSVNSKNWELGEMSYAGKDFLFYFVFLLALTGFLGGLTRVMG